mmetsp:Transcript_48698/g.122907  ORF Transcript_48698/g.122907 Transcript_48698/m.122907 type:complete len:435 (-) Transcript_48698:91-1395(-)
MTSKNNNAEEQDEDETSSSDIDEDDGGSESSVDSAEDCEEPRPPVRRAIVVMMCIVQAYATTNGPLRHKFKVALSIGDSGNVSETFTQAAVFVQYGKFAMTLGQNILFACVTPQKRVRLAMLFVFIGVSIPPLVVYGMGSKWIGTVFLSYGLIGLGLGIFEATFLSVITPLGRLTKAWAIMGFPAAFGVVNIVGMSLVSFGMPVPVLFWYISLCVPLGGLIFGSMVPKDAQEEESKYEQANLLDSLKDFGSWVPAMIPLAMVNAVSHFVMENVGPAAFDTFNDRQVSLFSPTSEDHLLNTDRYFVLLNVCLLLGDMGSRRLAFCFELPTFASNVVALGASLAASVLGFYLASQGVAVLTLLATALAFGGAGFNYGVSAKYIDRVIPKAHNLAAYSLWMFVGYAGAIGGTALVSVTRNWICGGKEYPHQCLSHHH